MTIPSHASDREDSIERHERVRDELSVIYRTLLTLERLSAVRFYSLSELGKTRKSLDALRDRMAFALSSLTDIETSASVYYPLSDAPVPDAFRSAFTEDDS